MDPHPNITDELLIFEASSGIATTLALSGPDELQAHKGFQELLRQYYHFSCCYWGCHGKEHIFEHLAGRTVSHAVAAYRLVYGGYYDEALSLVRSMGEIANLLNLFMANPNHIRTWLDADRKTRKKQYGPLQIRKALAKASWIVPFDDDEYRDLCETVTHPTPNTSPNAYANKKQPVLGALFQNAGFQHSTNRLYWALAASTGPTAKLAIMPEKQAETLVELTISLTELVTSSDETT